MSWTIYLPRLVFFVLLGCSTGLGAADAGKPGDRSSASPAPAQPRRGACALGMWVWESKYILDEPDRQQLLAFCKEQGIGRVLLQVHLAADKPEFDSPDELGTFLSEAAGKGIKVEALDGQAEMGLADHRAETLRRLDTVLAFNATRPPGEGFAGVHYDIEPYLGARWKAGDIQQVALENLATFRAIRDDVREKAPSLTVAYDIPAWYDKKAATEALDFEGHREGFQEHIQDLSDYVGVMSYRRSATGPNSVTDISRSALEYAEKTGKTVYPALETGYLKADPNISFYGTTPELVLATVAGVSRAFGGSPAFGGVLLHHYTSLRKLLESRPEASPVPHLVGSSL